MGLGEDDHEVKCHLHHIMSKVCTINTINDIDVDLDHLAGIKFYSSFCTIFFGGICDVRLSLKGWGVLLPLSVCFYQIKAAFPWDRAWPLAVRECWGYISKEPI